MKSTPPPSSIPSTPSAPARTARTARAWRAAPLPPELDPAFRPEEVAGHHLAREEEFYHIHWQWGVVEFAGQEGLWGRYECWHRHVDPMRQEVTEFALTDTMLRLEDEPEEEFTVSF